MGVENSRILPSMRREKIRIYIQEMGLWNISKTQMAREFGVSETQIRRDIKKIIKEIPGDKIKEPLVELFNAYIKSMKELRKILLRGTTSEKLKAINTILHLGDKFTRLLEDYGLKAKIADELKVKEEYTLADAYQEYMEEKNEKENKKG